LSLMFSLHQNQRTRGQNKFTLEARRGGRGERGTGKWGRGGPNSVYAYE
jgi:hypothetical protein